MESSLAYRERAAEMHAKAAASWFESTRAWRKRQAADYLLAAHAAEEVETRRLATSPAALVKRKGASA